MGGIEIAVAGLAGAHPITVQPGQAAFEIAGGAAAALGEAHQALMKDDERDETGRGNQHPQDGKGFRGKRDPNHGQRAKHAGEARVRQPLIAEFVLRDFGAAIVEQLRVDGTGV